MSLQYPVTVLIVDETGDPFMLEDNGHYYALFFTNSASALRFREAANLPWTQVHDLPTGESLIAHLEFGRMNHCKRVLVDPVHQDLAKASSHHLRRLLRVLDESR